MRKSDAVFEVHLDAITENFRMMKDLVGDRVEVAAVVKSDAYGLGLSEVSGSLASVGCKTFMVADTDEAARLRALYLGATIVVLKADLPQSGEIIASQKLTAVVNGADDLDWLRRFGHGIPYFLNVETGFSRFGIDPKKMRALRHEGAFGATSPACIFSHLGCSDNANDRTNDEQRRKLLAVRHVFPQARLSLSASAGIWLGRGYHLDVVRVGSAIYGLNNARLFPNPLYRTVRLRAPLVDIRSIPPRQAVGYGATFRTKRATRLGIVSIGYRHGLPWACANRMEVKIGEHFAPVIGRIAMEYTTIDLTDVPENALVRGGDVDFLHEDFGIDEMAAAGGTSSQETLVRLGCGCHRIHTDQTPATARVIAARRQLGRLSRNARIS
ncbi:alanine racemase [Rhizobium sp. NFR07]|uniref:alanine racemase n=1 Tax=Rhizobium sp. NFR07 TaxID=1566262 RepID=UPI0008E8B348|nr:alanine racemase [Rhizobium sp. NFR07]SFB63028.1 alanine racemase [Rhizobium sp. NFR07]